MLTVCKKLFEELNKNSIEYLSFKSIEQNKNDLNGERGDLDILLKKSDFSKADELLTQLNFRKAILPPSSDGICFYLGYDNETQKYITLHLHPELRFGSKKYKEFRWSIEDEIFKRKIFDAELGINTISKEDEFCLLFLRMTLKRNPKKNDLKRLKSCIQLGHLGVIEGPHASFLIRGVSRSFSHQFVRHRLFSFCQRSQRYCNEENFGCILPDDILESKLKDEYIEHVEKTRILYTKSIKDGNIKKESARSILNNGTETELTCSGNFRTYFEYLTKRAFNPHAQDEHREVALIIYKELKQISPNIFNKENFKYYVPEKDHKEIPE